MIVYGFYHGKSPINHHLGNMFFFPTTLSKSKLNMYIAWDSPLPLPPEKKDILLLTYNYMFKWGKLFLRMVSNWRMLALDFMGQFWSSPVQNGTKTRAKQPTFTHGTPQKMGATNSEWYLAVFFLPGTNSVPLGSRLGK